jgi:hypothetical protein
MLPPASQQASLSGVGLEVGVSVVLGEGVLVPVGLGTADGDGVVVGDGLFVSVGDPVIAMTGSGDCSAMQAVIVPRIDNRRMRVQ